MLTRCRKLRERARFWLAPKFARWIVKMSVLPSRKYLQQKLPFSCLVDNSVIASSVTHETGWISTGVSMWGPHEIETGHIARVPVRSADNSTEIYRNTTYLAGIAHLASEGRLKLCTSVELNDERMRQPLGRYSGYGVLDHNLFGKVKLELVGPQGIPRVFTAETLRAEHLRTAQLARINSANDPIFHGLVKRLGQKQSLDAWHWLTAERQGLSCFLTMDFKFRRSVERWKSFEPFASMKSRVLTPEELGRELGLIPVPPHLFSYTDASFFVRSDLYMPSERRRPVSGCRSEPYDQKLRSDDGKFLQNAEKT